MKNQISRDSFRPAQRYSGVYLQQGRMILDADWNELTDIQKSQLVSALRDAISGTTAEDGGIAGGAPRVGGLRLFASPEGSENIRIQPGVLYVEGVPARLDGDAPLAVNAQPDYPIKADYSGQNLRLYADVWERNVTALETDDLLDPALHGADTGTRTQTMLQVKWCSNEKNPLDTNFNPPLGDARLTLKLRRIGSSGDACDPCASQAVTVDERLGNYLFRVEVHDYDPKAQVLTLKWSRDNGAEACKVNAMPAGFDQGAMVWEYFDTDTEKLLGNHFAPNPKKLRGLLKDECKAPTGSDDPKTFVRQWDGALRFNLASGEIVGGFPNRDRVATLFPGTTGSQAHGRVAFAPASGALRLNLELMELVLDTKGRHFVPGDYWLAEVREAVDASGDMVLDAAPPRGVRHHYLLLGEIGVNKKLAHQNDAFHRRMAFPPLSDIAAKDVGFTNPCSGLYGDAENVQQALDELCAIDAGDIAYFLSDCGANEGKSIKNRLKASLDPDTDGKLTVKDALDTLLCQLDAKSLPYTLPDCEGSLRKYLEFDASDDSVGKVLDKVLCRLDANRLPLDTSDEELCTDLQAEGVVTVQDALKILCNRAAGGCAVVATSPDHLQQLLNEFAKSKATDLWICLKGGTYPLMEVPPIEQKRSLRISGEGPESVAIELQAMTLSVAADEVIFENLAMRFNNGSHLVVKAATARASGCRFSRTVTIGSAPAMIGIDAPASGSCDLAWRGNVLVAGVKEVKVEWASPEVVGDVKLSKELVQLVEQGASLSGTPAYHEKLREVADVLVKMPAGPRKAWMEKIAAREINLPTGERTKAVTYMTNVLGADALAHDDVVAVLDELVVMDLRPDYALRLGRTVGGTLEGNRLDGWLLLGDETDAEPPKVPGIGAVAFEGSVITAGLGELRLVGNRFLSVKVNLTKGALGSEGVLLKKVTGYARLFLSGNSFSGAENSFSASSFVGEGNTWSYGGEDWLGYVIADRASFTGNILEVSENAVALPTTAPKSRFASGGNVLVNLYSPR